MLYCFARVRVVVAMDGGNYYQSGSRHMSFRLQEKGGKDHEVPAHHKAQGYLEEYIEEAGLREEKEELLFRTVSRQREVRGRVCCPIMQAR